MARVSGIISLVFTDTVPTDHTLAATLSVNLSLNISALEEAHPTDYGARKFFPGLQSWSADNSFNEAIDTNGDRDVTHLAFENLALTRQKFAVVFTSAAGNTYTGTAWISSYVYNSGDEAIYSASVSLVGTGELVLDQNIAHPLSDINDLLLFLPESLTYGGGSVLWTNLGSLGEAGDMDTYWSASGANAVASGCYEDPVLGSVLAFNDFYEQLSSGTVGVLNSIGGNDDDSEMWLAFKWPAAATYGRLIDLSVGGGAANRLTMSADDMGWSLSSVGRLINKIPAATFNDDAWHVIRIVYALDSNAIVFWIDGYPLAGEPYSGYIFANTYLSLGKGGDAYGSIEDTHAVGFLKWTDGLLTQGRSREIWAYLRDEWEIAGIPTNKTVTMAIFGAVLQGDVMRIALLAGATGSDIDDQQGFVALGYHLRKDDTAERIYYFEGGASSRLKVCDYGGGYINYITQLNVSGNYPRGLAINLDDDEGYILSGTGATGNTMSKRSLDPADAAEAYTTLIASGSYEMHSAIEYSPIDDRIYFIDSLAATPTLRKITTAGASDTLVKSLTPGKVFKFLMIDPADALVFYFLNDTDGTIAKYAVLTDTYTAAWFTPPIKCRQFDIYEGKMYYVDMTNYKVMEVDMSDLGAGETEIQDVSGVLPGTDGVWGFQIIAFDTDA